MTSSRTTKIILGVAVSVCAMLPGTAAAQTTSQPSNSLPRNNVSGGAIAARRPGTWIQSAIGTHNERTSEALQNFGGVTYTEQGPEPSIRDQVLPKLVEILLQMIAALDLAIKAALQGGLPTGP
ncbi:MAG: hypothetical protein HY718_10750 [Planctomycetes bacterium]|nr:hypothetical protein [Planctomycetota bacterium]